MTRRLWIALLVLLFASSATAADWGTNNRIKPGENRAYNFTTTTDSAMLDARSCGTTVFSWQRDYTGSQETAKASLHSCPTATSIIANCETVMDWQEDTNAMNVLYRPGFFLVEATIAPTSTAIARVTAFCAKETVSQENYVQRLELETARLVPVDTPYIRAFNPNGRRVGIFVFDNQLFNNSPVITMDLQSSEFGEVASVCDTADGPGVNASEDTYFMVVGATNMEQLGQFDQDCNRPMWESMVINYSMTGVGSDATFDLIYYGLPN